MGPPYLMYRTVETRDRASSLGVDELLRIRLLSSWRPSRRLVEVTGSRYGRAPY